MPGVIERLKPENFSRLGEIWDWNKPSEGQKNRWLSQIAAGSRIAYIYQENGAFIAQGDLLLESGDADYVVPGVRACVSRLVVKKERRGQGIGECLL